MEIRKINGTQVVLEDIYGKQHRRNSSLVKKYRREERGERREERGERREEREERGERRERREKREDRSKDHRVG